ncbi:hypothetical protein GEMRC1_012911 [Eukaryota sp. GEM-RC1]
MPPSSSPPDTTVETETPDTTVETETPDTTVEEKSTRKRRNRRRPKKSKSSESSSASSLPSPSASSIPSSSLPSRPATTLTYVAATTDFVEDKVSKSKYPANNGFPEEAMIFNCINDAGEIIGRKVEVSPDSYFLPLTARKYRMNEERDLVKKGGRSITPHNLAQLRISRIIHIFGLPFEAAKSLNSLQSNLTSNVEKGKGKATLVFNELLRIPLEEMTDFQRHCSLVAGAIMHHSLSKEQLAVISAGCLSRMSVSGIKDWIRRLVGDLGLL